MSNKKKKSHVSKSKNKKKIKKLPIIIWSFLIIAILSVIIVCLINSCSKNAVNSELYDYTWIPVTANDASGDEVEMSEIYNTNYTSYQGSLTFRDDNSFSIWFSPGTPDDGTHTGKYSVIDKETISVTFDDGTETGFNIIRNDNDSINYIVVYYNDYEVYFTKQ